MHALDITLASLGFIAVFMKLLCLASLPLKVEPKGLISTFFAVLKPTYLIKLGNFTTRELNHTGVGAVIVLPILFYVGLQFTLLLAVADILLVVLPAVIYSNCKKKTA